MRACKMRVQMESCFLDTKEENGKEATRVTSHSMTTSWNRKCLGAATHDERASRVDQR